MSLMEEREDLTTLLDDVAKLHEVAHTLPAGDERAQALESVAGAPPGLRARHAAVHSGGHAGPVGTDGARLGQARHHPRPQPETKAAAGPGVRAGNTPPRRRTCAWQDRYRGLLDAVYNRLADEQLLAHP